MFIPPRNPPQADDDGRPYGVSTQGSNASGFREIRALTRGMKRLDEQAWQAFHAAYFQRLLRYLTVVLHGDEDAAAECVQQTFLRVVRHIKVFEAEAEFWRWLACLARCAVTDHQRSRRRYLQLLEKFDHLVEMRRGTEMLPERLVELDDAARTHMSHWRPEDRKLFERKYVEGWSYAELARDHDLSEKAVESRLGRLRQRLREHLMEETSHEQL
jgi:RNA polymerase sigma-70 factor (ECF subfamily)